MPTRRSIVTCLLCCCLAAPAWSGTIEGVEFDDELRIDGTRLALASLGLLRYRVIFKGYVAALYLAPGAPREDALGDVPKRLELEYFWSIDGDAIGEAGEQILARNVDAATIAALRSRLDRIGALYEDVAPGDRYSLTYLPGTGTTLAKNDRPLGTIEGADFASAYFSIWLGEQPIDAPLRDRLLGR